MNEYEKIALNIRSKISKLTLSQDIYIAKIYDSTLKAIGSSIVREIGPSINAKTITPSQKVQIKKIIDKSTTEMVVSINRQIENSVRQTVKIADQTDYSIIKRAIEIAGATALLKLKDYKSFSADKAVIDRQSKMSNRIIRGQYYKDKMTVSDRLWNYKNELQKDIYEVIENGVKEGKSADKLAKDLEEFTKDPGKRSKEWQGTNWRFSSKYAAYNAKRLSRTSINHAYQIASIESSRRNPFVVGMEWRSALIHGVTCQTCIDRHGHVYRFGVEEPPLDHPNGKCSLIPYIEQSLDDIAEELNRWIYGEKNSKMDDWFEEYGEYYATKTI